MFATVDDEYNPIKRHCRYIISGRALRSSIDRVGFLRSKNDITVGVSDLVCSWQELRRWVFALGSWALGLLAPLTA